MPISLSDDNRKLLEKTTAKARVLAESACRAALENLAVPEKTFWPHMSDEQKKLRNRLRARGRALGDKRDRKSNTQEIRLLTEAAAYEHWHRLLFTRFLTENNLLITDEANGHVPVTLEECEELAPELDARDGLDLACRFASRTLPGVFRQGDPVLDLSLALDDQVEMRKLLAALPPEIFLSDDALGWTYQFWQAQRKEEVNKSGKKIGADEIAPVTQLFTEDYMVEFLLHNTIGAWWAGKMGPIKADTEEEARAKVALPAKDGAPGIKWTYLRFVQDEKSKTWRPAAGTFVGWPKFARLIRLLDPCMGSGHFLVFAIPILVRLRMEEEDITPRASVIAVLNDNIHGLEIEERCTQIAAFNIALTAWKLAGYQPLPSLNLACSGLSPSATQEEWVDLAGESDRLQRGMARLYSLFKDAPILGSLVIPDREDQNLIEAKFDDLEPLISTATANGKHQITKAESDATEVAVNAKGLAKAAELLARRFTLVITNVPYLRRGKQCDDLRVYIDRAFAEGRADIATAFLQRCIDFLEPHGATACVSQQHFLYLGRYRDLRKYILSNVKISFISRLGPRAFEMISGENVTVALNCFVRALPGEDDLIAYVDAQAGKKPKDKANIIHSGQLVRFQQVRQVVNPDSRIGFSYEISIPIMEKVCSAFIGLQNGDTPRFVFSFWEIGGIDFPWAPFQLTCDNTVLFGGRTGILNWENGEGELAQAPYAYIKGKEAWGRRGVAVRNTIPLPVTLYSGNLYDQSSTAIIPEDQNDIAALWAFCSSDNFFPAIQLVDAKRNKTNHTYLKIPFDLDHWQKVAAEKYPNGLPKPHSDDPTQWLFNGHPKGSDQPLHVAVARLLGYQWPRQTGSSFPDCPALGPDGLEPLTDKDGIVCLPPLSREQPAAARLRQLLTAVLGAFDERALIASAGLKGSKSKTLEDWLRDEFFAQHAKLFHARPFIWHLWDGRRDGFHVLVNYHKLDHATLQKLTYSHLGNWIQQQDEDTKADKPGAADRLGAAQNLQRKLAAILKGEAPLDIFVRWKPIKDQAQGWHPDLNDGIRQNIRPFLLAGDVGRKGAGLFRSVPLKLKDRDRGKEPHRSKEDYPWFWCEEEPGTDPVGGDEFVGARWNNVHLSLEKKRQAHEKSFNMDGQDIQD